MATSGRREALTAVLGRAFVSEPMTRWPMGGEGDPTDRFPGAFDCFLRPVAPERIVWEVADGNGAAVWSHPTPPRVSGPPRRSGPNSLPPGS